MADIRIQIINYRTKSFVLECLRSLSTHLDVPGTSCTVAILDNASGDDLGDLAGLFPDLRLEIHQGSTNVGFGAGHNFLARHGDARFLLLLNPDTRILAPRTPQLLMQRALAARAHVVGPRLVSEDGTTQRWDHGELHGWLARLAQRTGNSYWRERADTAPAAWVSGAALLIEKRCFDDAGGFDEQFFLYKEDEELCWRVRAAGGVVLYDPTVAVFHHCGVVATKSAHLRTSTDHFLHKHFRHRWGYSVFRILNRLLH